MKDNYQILGETIQEVINILKAYDVTGWVEELEFINHRILNKWKEGPKLLLMKYGGMGSLNDIYICTANNKIIMEKDEITINKKLDELLSKAYSISKILENEN